MEARKIAGVILFAGATGFVIAMNFAEWLYPSPPGYSSSQNAISDLGATCSNGICKVYEPTSMIFNTCIIILGILIIAGSFFVYKAYGKRLFSVLLILSGIGAIGVGVFPETFGVIHSIFSLIVFLFGGLSAICSSIQIVKRPFSYFSVILGIVTLTSMILFTEGIYLGLGLGGMERMIVYPALLWGVGLGGYLLSEQEPKSKKTFSTAATAI